MSEETRNYLEFIFKLRELKNSSVSILNFPDTFQLNFRYGKRISGGEAQLVAPPYSLSKPYLENSPFS